MHQITFSCTLLPLFLLLFVESSLWFNLEGSVVSTQLEGHIHEKLFLVFVFCNAIKKFQKIFFYVLLVVICLLRADYLLNESFHLQNRFTNLFAHFMCSIVDFLRQLPPICFMG